LTSQALLVAAWESIVALALILDASATTALGETPALDETQKHQAPTAALRWTGPGAGSSRFRGDVMSEPPDTPGQPTDIVAVTLALRPGGHSSHSRPANLGGIRNSTSALGDVRYVRFYATDRRRQSATGGFALPGSRPRRSRSGCSPARP
jgi:hypothetical protein